ncbi:MAG: hypothetical protein ABF273_10270 [Wenyingzhuangia sp.]|uniref:hypothetical protein n=1 Tax=Wenyingzhuangia sp. TaxID=1964193 RepID=UPI003219DA35
MDNSEIEQLEIKLTIWTWKLTFIILWQRIRWALNYGLNQILIPIERKINNQINEIQFPLYDARQKIVNSE